MTKSFKNVARNLARTETAAVKISQLGHLEGKASTSNGKRR